MATLENIRQKLRASTMREKHVWEVLLQHPRQRAEEEEAKDPTDTSFLCRVLKEIYVYFSQHHLASQSARSFSSQSSPLLKVSGVVVVVWFVFVDTGWCQTRLTAEEVRKLMREQVVVPEELALFENLVTFADAILKTNFFASNKTSLSFRLDPSFLRREGEPKQNTRKGRFLVCVLTPGNQSFRSRSTACSWWWARSFAAFICGFRTLRAAAFA